MNIRSLLLTSLLCFASVAVHAQTVAPVPAPTIITTAPYTITRSGYYQLGADLVVSNTTGNIITINAGNVTLDFGGHYISGPINTGTGLYGVYANEQGNLTIKNGTIAYCYLGIFLGGNGTSTSANINQRVDSMLITYCYAAAVEFSNTTNSDLLNSRISFIGGSTSFATANGLYAFNSTGTKVSNNEVTNVTPTSGSSGSSYGLQGSASTFVIGNTVSNCQYGIYNGKYENNLTYGCTTPFSSGTNVSGNNGLANPNADPAAALAQ